MDMFFNKEEKRRQQILEDESKKSIIRYEDDKKKWERFKEEWQAKRKGVFVDIDGPVKYYFVVWQERGRIMHDLARNSRVFPIRADYDEEQVFKAILEDIESETFNYLDAVITTFKQVGFKNVKSKTPEI